jgi:hypothetical protein
MKRKKKAIRKSSHEILKEDAMKEDNEESIDNESERENYDGVKDIDELDIEDNGHLEDEEQGDEED